VAKKAIKAVQKNKAVCRVCPETYMVDWIQSLSRVMSVFQTSKKVKLMMGKAVIKNARSGS